MRPSLVSLACIALLASAADPALAGDSVAAQDNNAYKQQIVCKKLPPATGTRLGTRRVCQTQEQWDEARRAGQEFVDRKTIKHGFSRHDGGG